MLVSVSPVQACDLIAIHHSVLHLKAKHPSHFILFFPSIFTLNWARIMTKLEFISTAVKPKDENNQTSLSY